ncbi:MAG TPA: hypothetical protein VEV43_13740, partial [Actinomycetota bacterium]|nr:hypothetical protein [Actinomycetota bacterium]
GSVTFCAGWLGKNEDPVLQASGAVVVAGLALLGAAAGLSTWQEERQRAREQQQREVYAALAFQLLSRFTGVGGSDPQLLAALRTQVTVWAEGPVVEKLGAWNAVYDRYVPDLADGEVFRLSSEAKAEFERATAEVVGAVRKELSPGDDVSVETLTHALFNKPEQ